VIFVDILENIPIIAYHKISEEKEFGLTTISPNKFNLQLNILKEAGYHSITFRDIDQGKNLPQKPIIITFDDGYESVFDNALPLMQKHGFNGVVYIITDYIGKYNTWEPVSFQQKYKHLSLLQINALQEEGFEIASHGKTHRYLPSLGDGAVYDEVSQSKNVLTDLVGEKITSFCYPYGRANKRIENIVSKAGYLFATKNISLMNLSSQRPLSLIRRSIYATDSHHAFRSKLEQALKLSLSSITETIIQKGALASIAINHLRYKK